jgi:hypothetical protein
LYQIIDVPANAPEDPEPLGSKDKFWYADQEYLFKEARDESGEDWAEKVCAEVAGRLGLPHADYELATWQRASLPVRGVISRNFCRNGAALILGNELLPEADPAYAPGISKFRTSAHTLDRVLMTLHNFDPRLP